MAAEEPLGDIVQVTAVKIGDQRRKKSVGRFVYFIEQVKRTNESGTSKRTAIEAGLTLTWRMKKARLERIWKETRDLTCSGSPRKI